VYKGDKADNYVIKPTDDAHKTFTVNILTQQAGTAITVATDYAGTSEVNLTFNAYMVQAAGTGTAAEAWQKANFA
jgi:hypothetical protein